LCWVSEVKQGLDGYETSASSHLCSFQQLLQRETAVPILSMLRIPSGNGKRWTLKPKKQALALLGVRNTRKMTVSFNRNSLSFGRFMDRSPRMIDADTLNHTRIPEIKSSFFSYGLALSENHVKYRIKVIPLICQPPSA